MNCIKIAIIHRTRKFHPGAGGGGLLPYRSLLGMYRPKGYSFADILNTAMLIVLVLRRFGLERVQSLPILAWNRVWFSREVREFINVWSFQFQQMKLERKWICNGFKRYFCCRSNRSNDDIISARGLTTGWILEGQVWKRVWKMTIFGIRGSGRHTPTTNS